MSECKSPTEIVIGIFQDSLGKRHALPVDAYKLFRRSKFWKGCKHVTTTTRTSPGSREVKVLQDISAKVAKVGIFDLIANNWTL